MSERNSPSNSTIDEELVAYLDGELDADGVERFEACLAKDSNLQDRLEQHQRTWKLLDELPRAEAGDRFTETTVEMIAVSVADEVGPASSCDTRQTQLNWLLGTGAAVSACLAGYALVASIVAAPNRQLIEDLSVLEHLDEYRAIEDIDFLRALEREGLFAVEMDDEP